VKGKNMNNLEYLEKLKKDNFRKFVTNNSNYKEYVEGRKVLALEIIAEELCILNKPLIKMEMLKSKIQLRNLNKYMKKTSI
jgi:hypothetical protein